MGVKDSTHGYHYPFQKSRVVPDASYIDFHFYTLSDKNHQLMAKVSKSLQEKFTYSFTHKSLAL